MNKKLILAHRGWTKNNQENTLKACYEGLRSDTLDGIEIDLTITKDNEIILFHDDNCKRLLDLDKNINSIDYDIIKNLPLKNDIGIIGKKYSNKNYVCKINDFINLLENINLFEKTINIEFKYSEFDENKIKFLVNKSINLLKKYNKNIFFTSFNSEIVNYLVKNYKKNKIGQIIDTEKELNKILNKDKKVDILILNKNISNELFKKVKEKNYILGIYTINNYLFNSSDSENSDFDKKKLLNKDIDIFIVDKI